MELNTEIDALYNHGKRRSENSEGTTAASLMIMSKLIMLRNHHMRIKQGLEHRIGGALEVYIS